MSKTTEETLSKLYDRAYNNGRDIGMKADNVLRKEGYDKALEDVRVLIARHAKDDIDVPALVEDINKLNL